MTRISLWALSTLSVLVLLFGYHTSTEGAATAAAPPAAYSGTLAGTTDPTTDPTSSGSTSDGSTSSGTSAGTSTTYTGDSAQTQWGPVQVEVSVADGTITAVQVLQYPSGNGKDAEINGYALPILVQSTLDAQSADIDMVSGATVTSVGYAQSLQSALDQAGL
ncbi:FMN-binding protein [Nocardioides rubriscoriae]|uniref:FMN-binding protein n=1 Tax=Nocardioides rubriscoriae TaxID=642762 RepID=UPI0011DFB527|nr:FMN-binding protein [Nocardioides rubriscoriae]